MAIALALYWSVASEPWGMRVHQLVVFAAPGAVLGLGGAWMAHASAPAKWTWRIGRNAALAGALLLPPILAFLVAVDGNARPHQLLAGFIRAAWLALTLGGVIAVARAVRVRSQERRQQIRSRFQHALPPRSPQKLIQRYLSRMRKVVGEHDLHAGGHRPVAHQQRRLVIER